MTAKKWAYYFSKFTLIDEFLGFIYWGLAIYGLFLITGYIENQMVMIFVLLVYIVTVAILYIFIVRRVKSFFKRDSN